MELKIGDLVRHNVHGYHGIVVSGVSHWGDGLVVKVEWCELGKNHIIDVLFLDKVSESGY